MTDLKTEFVRHMRRPDCADGSCRWSQRARRYSVGRISASQRKRKMIKDEVQVGAILRELQERAKELNCLYKRG